MVNSSLLKTHRQLQIVNRQFKGSIRDAGDRREKGKSSKVKGKGQIHLPFIPNPLKTSRRRGFMANLKKQTQLCSLVFILRQAQDVVRGSLGSVQNCSKSAKKFQKMSKTYKNPRKSAKNLPNWRQNSYLTLEFRYEFAGSFEKTNPMII